MVFPWRLQNGEPRLKCATCLTAASIWSIKGNLDVRIDAVRAFGGSEVRPTVPKNARRADRSRDVGRQDGDAVGGTKRQPSAECRAASAEDMRQVPPVETRKGVYMVRMRIISVCAALAVTIVFPWRLQNGEPRPQCATCLTAASIWSIKGNLDVRIDAVRAFSDAFHASGFRDLIATAS